MAAHIKALSLDGTNEYVDCGGSHEADNLSVAVWVNCDNLEVLGWRGLISNGNNCTTDLEWWILNSYNSMRKIRVYVSKDGTYTNTTAKHYVSSVNVLPVSGMAHVGFTWASGALLMYVQGVAVAVTKTYDPAFTIIHDAAGPVALGGNPGYARPWNDLVVNAAIFKDAVLTPTDFVTLFSGGLSMDPADLVPAGGATLKHSWLWDTTLPLVPGANDVPDRAGTNHGTTQNVELVDVVDSPFTTWIPASRPYAYNRATKVADGSRTSWVGDGPASDSLMAFHPDIIDPADYEDFVVTGED